LVDCFGSHVLLHFIEANGYVLEDGDVFSLRKLIGFFIIFKREAVLLFAELGLCDELKDIQGFFLFQYILKDADSGVVVTYQKVEFALSYQILLSGCKTVAAFLL
jgi:hypothetical protein